MLDINERTKEENGDGCNDFLKAVAGCKMAVQKRIELMIERYQ
jgi:hypothetical protein